MRPATVSAKARAKAQNPIWGGRLGPLGPGPPKLVLGFGSGFGTDFFEKKSYTKVSDKFLSLTSLKKLLTSLKLPCSLETPLVSVTDWPAKKLLTLIGL